MKGGRETVAINLDFQVEEYDENRLVGLVEMDGSATGVKTFAMNETCCPWLPPNLELYREYHDTEWGVPSRNRRHLFEMICLEGAQAGLSWWTILQKRAHYKKVFRDFEIENILRMTDAQLEKLVLDPGIVRHRGKIFGVRKNAQAWLDLEASEGCAVEWLWSFVGGESIVNHWKAMDDYPSKTPESEALSKAMKKAGFTFFGPTIAYAFMQAVGMVDDHSVDCWKRCS